MNLFERPPEMSFMRRLLVVAALWGFPIVCLEFITVPRYGWNTVLRFAVPATTVGVIAYATLDHWLRGRATSGRLMAGFLLLVLACVGSFALRDSSEAAELSCLSAINASAYRVASQTPPAPIGTEWRVLTEAEATGFLSKVKPYDCASRVMPNGTLVDAWGRQFKVAVRQSDGGAVQIRVWSDGVRQQWFRDPSHSGR